MLRDFSSVCCQCGLQWFSGAIRPPVSWQHCEESNQRAAAFLGSGQCYQWRQGGDSTGEWGSDLFLVLKKEFKYCAVISILFIYYFYYLFLGKWRWTDLISERRTDPRPSTSSVKFWQRTDRWSKSQFLCVLESKPQPKIDTFLAPVIFATKICLWAS